MIYSISYQNPFTHLIDIDLVIADINKKKTYLQLPSWRPGRYEITNFAKNIQRFNVTNFTGKNVPFKKVTKDRWEVDTTDLDQIIVSYNYYAHVMDAGNSWLDEEQVYINFINCLIFDESKLDEPCHVDLKFPDDYKIACGLKEISKNQLFAENYYTLVNSPLIASANIHKYEYEVGGNNFFIWIQGTHFLNPEILIKNFKAFTEAQIQTFGNFPCKIYHFLIQALPYKHYHGVEHYNSTVITLGPSEKLHEPELYKQLLGISSHELFHTWNVIRIRPKELMPLRFEKENYFDSGFVAEGFTTYYGELYLVKSKIFSKQDFFSELNTTLKRHFDNFGRFNLSLAESSKDLWLDGYIMGVPGRKVSIYIKGAVIAFMLDLQIRKHTNSESSLDSLMKILWEEFGMKNKGYISTDIKKICEDLTNQDFGEFFNNYIFGNQPDEQILNDLLNFVGCKLVAGESPFVTENLFGFRTADKENSTFVNLIEPGSIADNLLSIYDEIIAIDGFKVDKNINDLLKFKQSAEITLFRNNKLKQVKFENTGERYFKQYVIAQCLNPTEEQKLHFEKWLGIGW
jgi:predicted metalloprotease with PDZ domain